MALKPLYLLDSSGWEQHRYDDRARRRIGELRDSGRLATCIVTISEMLFSARSLEDMSADHARLVETAFLTMTPAAEQHVVPALMALAARGRHRRPIPDPLIAGIARAHGAVVLHYDHDFELIAEVTGQPHEWIIPRGTGHTRAAQTTL